MDGENQERGRPEFDGVCSSENSIDGDGQQYDEFFEGGYEKGLGVHALEVVE